jgi:hypothetical protein
MAINELAILKEENGGRGCFARTGFRAIFL